MMTALLMNLRPLLFLKFLTLLAVIISGPTTYAGPDTLRNFHKEQFRNASEVKELILTADEVFVLSLDPAKRRFPDDGHKKFFHGFRILGKAEVTDPNYRNLLATALANDILGNEGIVAGCFEPRHGLRISKGAEVKDLVICFECASARCYNFNSNRGMLVSGSSASEFNKFLDLQRVRRVEVKD